MINRPNGGAIQVVECRDEDGNKGGLGNENEETKKVIRVITKYKTGPSLDLLLLQRDIKDLPILVFSVAGKTRGGKSFLLNLMIKFLEKQGKGNWMAGPVPNCFAWRGGIDSVTRGLWIWPEIYKMRSSDNIEVGILLLDNEGMFDGEASDGEMIALSGISTAISYLQMFNLKDKITTDYLETIVRTLVKGIEDIDSTQSQEIRQDYKLMFMVRDWIGEEQHKFGLQGGQEYIKKDSERGSRDNKLLWQEVNRNFSDVKCVLLPNPGSVVSSSRFTNSGDLAMLDATFLFEVETFITTLFSPENLVLPTKRLTGQDIYNMLINADNKVADENLSFMNVFTDHGNYIKVENLIKEFEQKLSNPDCSLEEGKKQMQAVLERATLTLRGRSAPQHRALLSKAITDAMNKMVISNSLNKYKEKISRNGYPVSLNQSNVWPEILRKLREYLCGDVIAKKEAMKKAAQNAAKIYYMKLGEEVIKNFKKTVNKLSTLKKLAGVDDVTISVNFKECTDFGNSSGDHACVHPIWFKHQLQLKDDLSNIYLERISVLTKKSLEELKTAKRKQYEYFVAFTLLSRDDNWDSISKNDKVLLQKKIGYAMFGLPENRLETSTEVPSLTNYSPSQEKLILPVAERILSLSELNEFQFSCVFVTFHQGNTDVSVPLFRVQSRPSVIEYVDNNSRVYQNWEDVLESNNFPDVVYCYPVGGCYNRTIGFSVAFAKTPASKNSSKVLKVTDKATNLVTGSAGVAGVAVVVAPLFGVVLAPAVGACVLVGGGLAGIYGVARCAVKGYDKIKHQEPLNRSDFMNFASNTLAVLGMGAFKAASEVAVVATRIASGFSSLNAFTIFCNPEDTPKTFLLLNEIADNALKILFYFNTENSLSAIKVIKKALKLETGDTIAETLETLVDFNSIQSTVEHEEVIQIEKYISQGIVVLVTSLLKKVSPKVKDVVLLFAEVGAVYNCHIQKRITYTKMEEKIHDIMLKLVESFENENKVLEERVTKIICENNKSEEAATFLNELMSDDGQQIIIVLRYLVCCYIERIRKANNFYNTIEHSAMTLRGFDGKFHPLREVTRQIRVLVQQAESATDLFSDDPELDNFIKKVLDLLYGCMRPSWRALELGKCIFKICKEIMEIFDYDLNSYENIVKTKDNPTCSDLDTIFEEIGFHDNYGCRLMLNVLEKCELNQDWQREDQGTEMIILPAWSGLVSRLYCYASSSEVTSKINLLKNINTKLPLHDYSEHMNLSLCCEKLRIYETVNEDLPFCCIYSVLNDKGKEVGLVWYDK